MEKADVFGARASLKTAGGDVTIYRLSAVAGLGDVERMPHVVKIVLENVLRNADYHQAFEQSHVETVIGWKPTIISAWAAWTRLVRRRASTIAPAAGTRRCSTMPQDRRGR